MLPPPFLDLLRSIVLWNRYFPAKSALTVVAETIAVSFAFQHMDTEEVTEVLSYTWTSFFGDFSGMAGILIGLDLIKVTKGMLTVSKAVTKKSIQPIAEALHH